MIDHETTPGLQGAFDTFSTVASRLQAAYENLQRTAASLDRKLAEANRRLLSQVEELENLSGSLAAVLRAIPCGVVVAGVDGTVLMANPAAERILALSGTALLGRRAADLADRDGTPLLCLAAPDAAEPAQERILHVGDGARIVDGCVVPVADGAGGTLGWVEVLNDRSEVRALQEEVRRLDRLAEMGRIAAIIAHEIRNPLAGIRGFAGLLERDLAGKDGTETQRRWTRRINEGVERADAIIDSVLFLARPRALQRAPLPAEALLLDAYESVAQAHPQRVRGLRVTRDVEPAGLTVSCDEVRLKQALANLIQNAVEALAGCDKPGPHRLELSARAHGDAVEICIADSGPGVPDGVRDKLFEPFFTTKDDGAGLGLALVQRIAELHGGTVRVDRSAFGGAAFTLSLPAAARCQGADRR
jgi:signal transduction histidine kinase